MMCVCFLSLSFFFLEVQPLRGPLVLTVLHILLSLDEVLLAHLHAAVAQRQQARLRAHGLDVGAGHVVLRHHELRQVNVLGEAHPPRVDVEDHLLRFLVRERELDLAVDAAGADQSGVERLDPVRRHDDLHLAVRVEAVELVQELQHRALDLFLAAAARVVALRADGVDLVDEHNRGTVLLRDAEDLAHELGAVAEVLLDELGANDAQERRVGLVRHGLRQQRLAGAGLAVQDDALRRLDADVLVELRVREGVLDGLLDLLDLRLETADVGVRLERRLVHLHDADEGVHLVGENANNGVALVVHQHAAAGLELVLVDEGHEGDVVLADGRDDGVVVVNHLLQRRHFEGHALELLHLLEVVLQRARGIPGLHEGRNELFLHQQIVLDTFEAELLEFARLAGVHLREARGRLGALRLLLATERRRRRGLPSSLLLLVVALLRALALAWSLSHYYSFGLLFFDFFNKVQKL
eukprot:PhM_4_TR10948/c1_g5_i1/m.88486